MIKAMAPLVGLILLIAPTSAQSGIAPEPDPVAIPTMQEHVKKVLDENRGGTQIGWNEISWDSGEVILTISPDGIGETTGAASVWTAAATSACPTGRYCAFSSTGYRGSRLSVATCTNTGTNALPQVRSIANSRTSGTVRAYNGTRLVATVAARSGRNVSATVTRLTCT